MKLLMLILAIAIFALPMVALAQSDSMVVDTTIVTPSPIDFDKYLNPETLARLFGAPLELFIPFIAVIIIFTEVCKRGIKRRGERFFIDNKSFFLPPIVGVAIAIIVPLGFSLAATVRFGLQGAVSAMIIHYLTSFMHTERK